jgi:hypothetical protein
MLLATGDWQVSWSSSRSSGPATRGNAGDTLRRAPSPKTAGAGTEGTCAGCATCGLHRGPIFAMLPPPVPPSRPIVAPRKLIEVALPLDEINKAAAREKSIRHGHPSTLHLWHGHLLEI